MIFWTALKKQLFRAIKKSEDRATFAGVCVSPNVLKEVSAVARQQRNKGVDFSFPALEAYISRIGAEQHNFRTYIIKDYKGEYYTERVLVRVLPDGSIYCSSKEHSPTKEEAEAIKATIGAVKWPTSIQARTIEKLRPLLQKGSEIYELVDQQTGHIIMVQERAEIKGAKRYFPWTFFSDGEWRRMEPDKALPFWKPKKKTGAVRYMIHEGCKAAKFISDLVANKEACAKHPWGEFLSQYEHWGMIGGALAPHRTDYDELRRQKPVETIYVCDNDWPGNSALQEVSKCYGGSLKGIRFDERWKESWDMADDMPETLFTKEGRYIGPQLEELIVPATRATELIPNPEGKGKPVVALKRAFKEEWFHCVAPEVFIHRDWPSVTWTADEFNSKVSPYSDVHNTALLLKKDDTSKSAVLKYTPEFKPGIFSDGDSGRFINTHVPSRIRPKKGDIKPWLDYIEHLVPDEGDRHELMKWCATLIAKPEIKMLYGVLLISETQGVGKSTLGEKILDPLVGSANVSYPSEKEITDPQYNYWLAHKRLAVVHEIYAGHSSKAYNHLKNIITDKYITVSKKYIANYQIENWVHVMACSNSLRALHLPNDDRRWFVPKVNEITRERSYWEGFNKWLTEGGGLEAICYWAHEFVKKKGYVQKGDVAPMSALKREMIEESYSPGQAMVARVLDRISEILSSNSAEDVARKKGWEEEGRMKDGAVFVLDSDLVQLIKNQLYEGRHNDRLERPATIRRLAKGKGWVPGELRASVKEWGGASRGAKIICSNGTLARMTPGELWSKFQLRPLNVEQFLEM